MTVIFQDTATRANSTTSIGTPDIGGPYTVVAGTWGIISNQIYTPVSVANARVTFPGSYDFDVTLEFPIAANNTGFIFRYADVNNHWMIYWSASTMWVWRNIAGAGVNLFNMGTVLNTDVFRVVGKGRYLYFFVNGVRKYQIEDSYSPTASTMGYWMSSVTGNRIDNVTVNDAPPDMSGGVDGGDSTLLDELTPAEDPLGALNSEILDLTLISVGALDEAWVYKGRDYRSDDEANIP